MQGGYRRRGVARVRFGGLVAMFGVLLCAGPALAENTYTVTGSGDDSAPATCSGTGTAFNCGTPRDAISASGNTSAVSGAPVALIGSATLDLESGVDATLTGTVSGAGALTETGSNTLTLGGANTMSGGVIVSGGTLSVSADNNLGAAANTLSLAAGTTLALTGGFTFDHPIKISGDPNFDVADGKTVTISSVIADGGSPGTVEKTDTGTLILSGANTYTGPTTVSGGTLGIGTGGTIATSSGVSLAGGTTFDISGGGNQTIQDLNGIAGSSVTLGANTLTLGTSNSTSFAGAISGTGGGLTKQGSGTLTLSGVNSYTGVTTINAGTLALGAGGSIAATGGVNLTASGAGFDISNSGANQTIGDLSGVSGSTVALGVNTLTVGTANSTTFAGIASGNGGLTKEGSGILILSAVNTYTGATTVNAGTLALTTGSAIADSSVLDLAGSGAVLDISGSSASTKVSGLSGIAGALVNLGSNQLVVGSPGSVTNFAGVIQGTGSLFELPTGSLTLTGTNTYTGVTDITSGTLAIGAGGSIASSSGVTFLAGGTFDITDGGNQTIGDLSGSSGTVILGGNTLTLGTAASTSYGGVFTGAGGVTKQNSGTLTLSGINANFTGTLTINGGAVTIGPFGSVSSASVNLATPGATFNVTSPVSPQIQDLSGVGGTTVNLGTKTLTLGTANATSFAGVIQGTGGITKEGVGTLTLSGTNTYTGATTVNAGTLALGNTAAIADSSGASLTAAGATLDISGASGSTKVTTLSGVAGAFVNLGPNQLVVGTTGSVTTFAGVIEGTGGLFLLPTGSLTLTGVNTYTGATQITTGTLAIGSGGSIAQTSGVSFLGNGIFDISGGGNQTIGDLSGSGTVGSVTLGANTLTLGSANSTSFGGVISGTGGITKQGAGKLILGGVNTLGGTVTVNGGTVAIGPFGSVSAASVNLGASGGTFDVSSPISPTIRDLSGVSGTTLNLGARTLTLGTANSTNFAGNVVGSGGALIKQGTGNLTLAGTDSYTGGTTIANGTLTGTTSSLEGSIFDRSALVFDQSTNGTYAGTLSGAGTLAFLGTGTVTMSGNSSGFAGTTNVSSGDLAVGSSTGGSLGGNVNVTGGGTVSGHGTIGGSLANPSGTVRPGGSVGTLTVNGSYTQGSNGTLAIQLTPAGASKLAVSGTVSLQGSLDILSGPNGYVPFSTYTILTSGGGITGTFATVEGTPPIIPLTVQYQSNEIDLVLSGFTGATSDENAVAAVLNSSIAGASGDFLSMLDLAVVLPAAQMQRTLSSLGGQIYGNLAEISLQDRRLFLDALTDRTRVVGGGWPFGSGGGLGGGIQSAWGGGDTALKLAELGNALTNDQQIMSDVNAYASRQPQMGAGGAGGLWARGFGQLGDIDGNSGALGASYSTGGGAIGADVIATPRAVLGFAVGGGQSSVSLGTNPENGTVSFFQGGIYGAKAFDVGIVLDGAAIYSHDIYDVTRGIVLPGASRTATSTHGGDDAVLEVGLSRTLFYNDLRVIPRIGASYFRIGQSSFSEAGASSLDLSVNPSDFSALYSRVGVTLVRPMVFGDTALVPELRVAWLHNFLDNFSQFGASFAGAPSLAFEQSGAPVGRDAADLGAGVSFGIARTSFGGELSGFVQYEASLAAHETTNTFGAGVRLKW